LWINFVCNFDAFRNQYDNEVQTKIPLSLGQYENLDLKDWYRKKMEGKKESSEDFGVFSASFFSQFATEKENNAVSDLGSKEPRLSDGLVRSQNLLYVRACIVHKLAKPKCWIIFKGIPMILFDILPPNGIPLHTFLLII